MKTRIGPLSRAALLVLSIAWACASIAQESPLPGTCGVSATQIAEEKRIGSEFFRPGITPQERVALFDASYIQHNPLFVKIAEEKHVSAYEEFKGIFLRLPAQRPANADKAAPVATNPRPRSQLAIVTAECDIVTVIRKIVRPDPTAAAGVDQETFTWDTFRIRNGKIVEHWDGEVITEESLRDLRRMEPPEKTSAH